MDPKQRQPFKYLLAAAFMGLCAAAYANPLWMTVDPLYQGDTSAGVKPWAVRIQNSGREAKGLLHVTSAFGGANYPVDVAANSTQRVIVYASSEYQTVDVRLDADTGNAEAYGRVGYDGPNDRQMDGTYSAPVPVGVMGNGESVIPNVLVIGDNPGSFAFLESQHPGQRAGTWAPTSNWVPRSGDVINDIYCSPEDAQPRVIAYQTAAAVVLGPGAERMSAGAVQALKQYAMEGGTLIFFGGTSGSSLTDPRWQDDLPASDYVRESFAGSDGLEELSSEELKGPIALWQPKTINAASVRRDKGQILSAESGYGFGRILVVGFDPMDDTFRQWGGRWMATYSLIKPNLLLMRMQDANSFGGDLQQVVTGKADTSNDPFNAKLPPFGQVFGILAMYFIAVLPVNFLVLRKLRRAELAWVTAPILSLGFASLLFRSAGSLYGSAFSTASKGVVIARSGSPDGLFVGETAMFLPNGGHYDLAMNGIDSIGSIYEPDSGRSGYSTLIEDNGALNIHSGFLDNGQVNVSNLTVGNLAFRRIDYTQRLNLGNQYSVTMHMDGNHAICEVTNGSDHPLSEVHAIVQHRVSVSKDLAAHSSDSFVVDLSRNVNANQAHTVDDIDALGRSLSVNGGAAFEATMNGFRPGPQVGDQIDARTQVTLLVFSKDAIGGQK